MSGVPPKLSITYTKYYLYKNLQGDVVQIRDKYNAVVANYSYDAWGNLVVVTSATGADITSNTSHIAYINPIRYRGYYYDTETGFYYLQSRYYDPAIGRFISADDPAFLGAVDNPASLNLFAYCYNDPVNMTDDSGNLPFLAITGIAGALIGGIIGYAKTGSVSGALTGALIGGAIGLAGGAVAGKLLAGSAIASTGSVIAGGKAAIGIVSTTVYSSWQSAEQALRDTMNSVQSTVERTFSTPHGNRIADAFNTGLHKLGEAKYGYQSLTDFIKRQIQKDAWLLANDPRVKQIEWHFYHSQVSNSHGLSDPLRKALEKAGIKIVEHYQ